MPIQKLHSSIWVACISKETHVVAGKKGLSLLPFTLLVVPEELRRRVHMYRETLKEAEPPGTFINNKAGVFSLVHRADKDKRACEKGDRASMSYVAATLQFTAPVL